MSNPNSKLWASVSKTDPAATKTANLGGRQQTSIDGYWVIGRATEAFGPMGIGWGYDIEEERLDDGVPILLSQGDGNPPLVVQTKTHTIKLRLWYILDGRRGEVVQYGHTPAIYRSKNGANDDGEAPKKSLMDAIKKSLSMLGFCADVFTGEFDDRDYVAALTAEIEIEKAADKDREAQAKRDELTEFVKQNLELLDRAASLPEVNGIEKLSVVHLRRREAISALSDISKRGVDAIAIAAKKARERLEVKS